MQRITREQSRKYAFDWRDEPLLRVQPGESFEIETYDASTGYFKTPEDKAIPGKRPGFDRTPPTANPIGGPVYLEGAERGDVLVVTLEDIRVDDYSWIAIGPRRGPLGESTRWPELSGEYTTKIFRHTYGPSGTTRDGMLHFSDKIRWPITPFVGTLGVSPDREVATSLDGQGPWGGNLDIRDAAVGNRIHLPIYHPGALFSLGDVHASQGDTEFTGTAAETKATVRVKLELAKKQGRPPKGSSEGGTTQVRIFDDMAAQISDLLLVLDLSTAQIVQRVAGANLTLLYETHKARIERIKAAQRALEETQQKEMAAAAEDDQSRPAKGRKPKAES